jgi:hypothetical protein
MKSREKGRKRNGMQFITSRNKAHTKPYNKKATYYLDFGIKQH